MAPDANRHDVIVHENKVTYLVRTPLEWRVYSGGVCVLRMSAPLARQQQGSGGENQWSSHCHRNR